MQDEIQIKVDTRNQVEYKISMENKHVLNSVYLSNDVSSSVEYGL